MKLKNSIFIIYVKQRKRQEDYSRRNDIKNIFRLM